MSTPSLAPARPRVSAARTLLRILLLLLLALATATIAGLGWVYFTARSVLPQLDGSIRLGGLSAQVSVLRDAQGVPHIRAQNMSDLLFAQGYVTAQDRLWQLDITRRYASGQVAEILGADFLLHDRQQRILSLQQMAERSVANLAAADRRLLQAYVAGVNAFIETHRDHLPLEFKFLHYQPRAWTPADSFLIGANMAQYLSHDSFGHKLARERITEKLGPELAADLYPNRSWRDRLPGTSAELAPPDKSGSGDREDGDDSGEGEDMEFTRLLGPQSEAEDARRAGSNNWVLSGAHTVSGRPLLSNDMHLGHQIPNIWYEAQLTAGDFDVAGVTLMLSKGATARGRIRFDTGNPPQGLRPSQVFVMPTFVDPFGDHQMAGMGGGPPVTHDDWTFELQGLRGRGFIRAGTESDWQMKRVQREGVDVTDTTLDFATDVDGLEIELTQRLTTVSGGISDDRGGVALDTTVIVFADDPGKWGPHSRFIESARPDQQGRFTIRGLPPGWYVAIAVGYLQPGEERDPDVLEAWRQGATHFTLSEGETHALDLRLSAF